MRTLTYKFHSHEKQAENTSDPESSCGPVFSFLHFWSPWKTIKSRDELVDLKPALAPAVYIRNHDLVKCTATEIFMHPSAFLFIWHRWVYCQLVEFIAKASLETSAS